MDPTKKRAVLALDVGGTTIKGEVLTPDLTALARFTVPTPYGPGVVQAIADTGRALLESLAPETRDQVSGVGLAFPGVLDTTDGVSVYAANLGLHETPIIAPLTRLLGLPVSIEHDVAAAAEAERRRGAARRLRDPVIVVIGTGIAAVSYVNGDKVVGVSGHAGEVGHLVVRPAGPRCSCGARGCLEAVASASAVARAYREASGQAVSGAADVVARLGEDAIADRVWGDAADALADGLLAILAVLAPGAVVLGGGLAEAGPALLAPVLARLRERAHAVGVPPLLTAEFGSRAGVVGAALIALDNSPAHEGRL